MRTLRTHIPGVKQTRAGFTMIEIAVCLAIVGFAVVAVVGVLPTGLNIQRDTRERTQILQDVTYIGEAIQQGARGTNDLLPYVKKMWQVSRSGAALSVKEIDTKDYVTDADVIALLSAPTNALGNKLVSTVALMRSLSGPSSDKTRTVTGTDIPLGFDYFIRSELRAVDSISTNTYASDVVAENLADYLDRSAVLDVLGTNLHEVRLSVAWPAANRDYALDSTFRNEAVFRFMIGGLHTVVSNRADQFRLERRRFL